MGPKKGKKDKKKAVEEVHETSGMFLLFYNL